MTDSEPKLSKKQILTGIAGALAMLIGIGMLSFLGIRKIRRELHKQELMRTNVVIEIPDLHIKAPVLEGTELSVLSQGAGHFTGTGAVGKGNYCIAGHSSVIYKEYFNQLKYAQPEMLLYLYDIQKNAYVYTIRESFIVNPDETWILNDFDDDRVTLVTCTDDGSQRLIITAILNESPDYPATAS